MCGGGGGGWWGGSPARALRIARGGGRVFGWEGSLPTLPGRSELSGARCVWMGREATSPTSEPKNLLSAKKVEKVLDDKAQFEKKYQLGRRQVS